MKHLLSFECFETCFVYIRWWSSSPFIGALLPFSVHYVHHLLLPSEVSSSVYVSPQMHGGSA